MHFLLVSAFLKFGINDAPCHMAKLLDQTGTELDEYVFEEVLKQPDVGVLLLKLDDDGQGKCGSV